MRDSSSICRNASSIIEKLVPTAFGLCFAFAGSLFVAQEYEPLQTINAMQSWNATPCVITHSDVKDAGEDFKTELTYRYAVGAKNYTSTQWGLRKHKTSDSLPEAQALSKKYAMDSKHTCYVNPTDPTDAIFKMPSRKGTLGVMGFTLIFPIVGLIVAITPWFKKK